MNTTETYNTLQYNTPQRNSSKVTTVLGVVVDFPPPEFQLNPKLQPQPSIHYMVNCMESNNSKLFQLLDPYRV